jgi:glycosyltransferase involved in cell wall biosynthesis
MFANPACTIIIPVYKNKEALFIILHALEKQSVQNFEVVVAEDNEDAILRETIKNSRFSFPLKHVQQVDDGFRKCAILNKAVAAATADYLLFLDGDCVPHPHFVKGHLRSKKPHAALFGRRVMLSEKFTTLIYKKPHLLESKFLFLYCLFFKCKRMDAFYYLPFLPAKKKVSIWGCNWSVEKRILLEVGGFDEAYTQAGIGEDVDVTYRLLDANVTIWQIKHRAIQYHLWHPVNYTSTKAVEEQLRLKRLQLGLPMR